ncbi:hypothetical protein OO184_20490 [Photorhabdus sp. APURE]|uniref:hypothetical protein n=1 Tax=Photorhabdus aballayi TaxID=2991723 RepID=UPI00223CCB00|nr:hypothetical protein [Photorhabdus aballayi]MCW7550245.1 hypothetical protein [Photorhabdus aballayi]
MALAVCSKNKAGYSGFIEADGKPRQNFPGATKFSGIKQILLFLYSDDINSEIQKAPPFPADIDINNAGLCTNSLSLHNKSKFFSYLKLI